MRTLHKSLMTLAMLSAATAYAKPADSVVIIDEATGEEVIITDPEKLHQLDLINNTEVLYYGNGEVMDTTSYQRLLNNFYEDQFRHAQDPRAPYFMMMSRSGNIAMGIGGDLKLLGSYDMNGSMHGGGFAPYDISMVRDKGNDNLLQLSPTQSSLFFSVFGTSRKFGDFQVYIQAKFAGPSNTFKLSKAYATLGHATLGLAKSTFDDPISQPQTIDTDGPNSEIDDSRVLLRYMQPIGKKLSYALSVECPDNAIPTTSSYEARNVDIPDFAAFVQYAYKNQHIRLSGIVRTLGYIDRLTDATHHVTGWGVNLSMKLRPADFLTVFGSVNTGQGIGSMVNDLSNGDNDLLGLTTQPGKMYAPRSYGWYGALQFNFSKDLFSTLIVSQERLLTREHSDYSPSDYKYGLYGTANIMWNIVPRVQLGAEFNIGKRVNMDGANHTQYRAALMTSISF